MALKLLVVEPDKDFRETLSSFLVDRGYEVQSANDGRKAQALFADNDFFFCYP